MIWKKQIHSLRLGVPDMESIASTDSFPDFCRLLQFVHLELAYPLVVEICWANIRTILETEEFKPCVDKKTSF